MTQASLGKKITVASVIMMGSVFLSRVIGLFREMAIAAAGGTGAEVDAYLVAFILPDILNHIMASGFLSITFIPIFSACMSTRNPEQGWRIFSIVLNAGGMLLLVFIGISIIFTPELVTLLAPGIQDPEIFEKAVRMTRIVLPAQFFFFCGGLFMAVQFANERFFIPALAPLVYNLFIILGGLVLYPLTGIEGFSWGVLAGAVCGSFLLQMIGARKVGLTWSPALDFSNPEFKKYLVITLPFILGLTMTFSSEFLFKFFGSFLGHGSIAVLNYNMRIMFMLIGFFGQAVGTAAYPYMARFAALNQIDELNRLLNRTLKFLLLVIPFSVLLGLLRFEIVTIIYKRGAFDLEAVIETSRILPYFMIGAFAFTCQTIVTRGYYATQNTWFPAIVNSLAVIAFLPVYYLFTTFFNAPGLALAISLGAIVQTVILYALWNRKSDNRYSRQVYLFFLKTVMLSLIAGVLVYPVTIRLQKIFNDGGFWDAAIICIIAAGLFTLVFGGLGYIFKVKEIFDLSKQVGSRIKKLMA